MKCNSLLLSRCQIAARSVLLSLTILTSVPASAQNLVKNPDFEEPLGPDNWTIVYALGGPNDFFIKGRTRLGHKDLAIPTSDTWDGEDGTGTNYWNKFGLHFKAGHDWLMHAYASQIITNLTPGASYTASAWITQFEGQQVAKVLVYMEVLGGPAGTVSKITPYVTTVALNNPSGWNRYAVTNTASNSGQIEIRLHYNKNGGTTAEKWRNMDGLFDQVSLMLASYYPNSQPTLPYRILSFSRTNQDAALTWETVMNNRYRVQASTNISDSNAWVMVKRPPNVDTNLVATGTNFTFKTNLLSLFSYDPYFAPDAPLFFRIYSESFKP